MATFKQIACVFFVMACFSSMVSAHTCFQQICRECNAAAEEERSDSVDCNDRSQVSAAWLDDQTHLNVSGVDFTGPYACIKMVAALRKTDANGDSTDVIRGCTLKSLAKTACESLESVAKKRSKVVECKICDKTDCNGSVNLTGSVVMLILSVLSAKIITY